MSKTVQLRESRSSKQRFKLQKQKGKTIYIGFSDSCVRFSIYQSAVFPHLI